MSRSTRNEKHVEGRPERRAAKIHCFKYQFSRNPRRLEQYELRKALQESLEEQSSSGSSKRNSLSKSCNKEEHSANHNSVSSTKHSDISNNCNSGSSASSNSTGKISTRYTRSKLGHSLNETKVQNNVNEQQCDSEPKVKRAKIIDGHHQAINNNNECDNKSRVIRTYSRSQPVNGPRSSTPVKPSDTIVTPKTLSNASKITEEPKSPIVAAKKPSQARFSSQGTQTSPTSSSAENGKVLVGANLSTTEDNLEPKSLQTTRPSLQVEQYLKPRRESKSDAYAKISFLNNYLGHNYICNTHGITSIKRPSPSGSMSDSGQSLTKISLKGFNTSNTRPASGNKHNQSSGSKKNPSPNSSKGSDDSRSLLRQTSISLTVGARDNQVAVTKNNASTSTTKGLSILDTTISQTSLSSSIDLDLIQRRVFQKSSWAFLGIPEEKIIYLRNDEHPRRLICYPAIKHIEGDVIQVRDSVLLRSGPKKTDIPYIAKVCAFWQDASSGSIMMSLFWYYRPEHTEEGRKPHHLVDEIFASRHRDVDSVDCIEDKCYVLTFNEYCRYKKRCKMAQVKTTWSLTDVTIPVANEAYPRRNRIPDGDVNPELVFCCRQIYDSRMKRLIKNPLINSKYGHI